MAVQNRACGPTKGDISRAASSTRQDTRARVQRPLSGTTAARTPEGTAHELDCVHNRCLERHGCQQQFRERCRQRCEERCKERCQRQVKILIVEEEAKQNATRAEEGTEKSTLEEQGKSADAEVAGTSVGGLMREAAPRKSFLKNTRDDAQGGAAGSLAKKPPTLILSKRDETMNEWALSTSVEVAEGAVEASGGPLGWWQKASRIYPYIAMPARKFLCGSSVVCCIRTSLFRRRNRCYQEAEIIFLHESIKHKLW